MYLLLEQLHLLIINKVVFITLLILVTIGLTTAGIGVTNWFGGTYTQQVDWFSTQED